MYYFYGCGSTRILEKLMCRSCGLYLTTIRIIESNNVFRDDLLDSDTYRLWYDCLGYPGRDMMIRILKTSHGHPFIELIEARIKSWFKEMRQLKARTKMLLSDARRPVEPPLPNGRPPSRVKQLDPACVVDRSITLSNGRHPSREHRRTVEYLGDRSTKRFSTFSDEQFVATSSPYDQIFMV